MTIYIALHEPMEIPYEKVSTVWDKINCFSNVFRLAIG